MPGVKTHDFITVATAAAGVAAYWKTVPQQDWTHVAAFTIPYLFAGFACAGDLDTNSTEYKRWGPLRVLWFPYQKLVPHRSWISHGLILGGAIRVLYLLSLCVILAAGSFWAYGKLIGAQQARTAAAANLATLEGFVQSYPYHIVLALAGFILAGTVHAVSDMISTFFKKLF